GAMQPLNAFDGERAGADAGNPRAHGNQAFGDIGDFGFAGSVLDDSRALGQGGGHQDGVGGSNRHLREDDGGADQAAAGRPGNDIALIDIDLGAERLEPEQEQINRPGANGAAAGQRDAGFVAARQKGTDHPETGA